jgi:DNA primase
MSLTPQFLDEIRARTTLSAVIGRSIKIEKAGREYKACCPFHGEKTPSFTINDDKGFYHCFGCAAHGDVIRWMTDHQGLGFIDAVKELAAAAGLEMPMASPAAAARAARIEGIRPALSACADYFRDQIISNRAVGYYLQDRGITPAMIDHFGLGYAPKGKDYCRHLSIASDVAVAAGLMWQADGKSGLRFIDRIMVPVHDARGQIISFGGRDCSLSESPDRRTPKYKNGSDTELFDKGRTLFNLHRALPHARAKAGSTGRLIVVEGYMDVIALTGAGIAESVAPMGTALTPTQLEMLWRVHPVPILMFDGDAAGQKAALRACETALPFIGPGKALRVAICPSGKDPDDVIRAGRKSGDGGAREIEALCLEARAMSDFIFDAVASSVRKPRTPEDISGIWYTLETLAGHIADDETRQQYAATWRARFEREISVVERPVADIALMTYRRADEGDYLFPDTEDEAERRLIYIVQNLLKLRESERLAVHPIRETKKTVKAMAKAMGLDGSALDAVCKMIEADPATREEKEMTLALYRRVLGIRGPMLEAMLPQGLPAGVLPRRHTIAAPARPALTLAWHDVEDAA